MLKSALSRYGFAVVLILAAFVVTGLLFPTASAGFYLISAGAVAAVAWFAGTGPGLTAAAFAIVILLASSLDWLGATSRPASALAVITFAVVSSFLAWIGSSRRRILDELASEEVARRELEAERLGALEKERAGRQAAERASHRAEFLAEAGAVFAESLDLQRTALAIASLALPRIADYAGLFLVEDGVLRPIAHRHAEPELQETLDRSVDALFRMGPDYGGIIGSVIHDGQERLINANAAERGLADTEFGQILAELDSVSVVAAPVVVRGSLLGVIVLGRSSKRLPFTEEDLCLVSDIARRAAVAIDNARLYERAEHASSAKDQFLAVLSHELRTPLTPALAAVEALLQEAAPRSTRDLLEIVHRNIELEARLIDDLLDLTRIIRGKLEIRAERVDVAELISQVIEIVRSDLEPRQLLVTVAPGAGCRIVNGDSARLQQVLWNLLKNAIKFTPDGGHIALRTRTQGGRIAIEVADTGLGIARELLPSIFDAFEQGEKAAGRSFGGLGLGLTISRTIAEMHGGEITVRSDGIGTGAMFTLWLPLAEQDGAQETAANESGTAALKENGGGRSILVVDDHRETASVMQMLLARLGYDVDVAFSAHEALELVSRRRFDLVISDIGLRDGNGHDLLRRINEISPVKAIAVSGYGAASDLARSHDAGFAAHLVKPFSTARLNEEVRRVLRDS